MAAVSAVRRVELDPEAAWRLWTSLDRWPTFVEGFAHVIERRGEWPEEGARVVWNSIPGGRGRVTETVTAAERGAAFATQVYEEALSGTQLMTFGVAEDGRTRVELRLDYALTDGNFFKAIADALFIRRALSQMLDRTLERFATEAAEEASL